MFDQTSASSVTPDTGEEDFTSTLINASLDGIVVYDRDLRYTVFSPSIEKLCGMKREDVLGRNALEVFPFIKAIGLDQAILKAMRGEECRAPIFPFTVPETGRMGFAEQQNFPLRNEQGEIVGVLGVIRDVTEFHKNLEELAEKNRILELRVQELEQMSIE
ncbi:MAG: PAS domain S-box protein [Oligoflexia bacterium]|nr:PAS domain S-box protein [Oligoflexia bacterium]